LLAVPVSQYLIDFVDTDVDIVLVINTDFIPDITGISAQLFAAVVKLEGFC